MELYIHIPFCIKKCDYCDFLSFPAGEDIKERYVEALKRELCSVAEECAAETISSVFIGGGTPSALCPGQIAGVMETVRKGFVLERGCEVTLEANPGTLNMEKLLEYRSCGVNRLSIGCQSADDGELRSLGRIHTFQQFQEQFALARAAGFGNINVDLMSAIPGQSVEKWERSLRTIAGMEPEHISAYSLIIEEGTPFFERELQLPTEEEERRMYEMTAAILGEYGYHRYEISNYAREGRECRHNIGYWKRVDYLGVGLGASSLRSNRRFSNTSRLEYYLENSGYPDKIRENTEELSEKDRMEEFIFLGLRLTEGISEKAFRDIFHRNIRDIYGMAVEKMTGFGLLEEKGERLRLTERGVSLSNQVFLEFL